MGLYPGRFKKHKDKSPFLRNNYWTIDILIKKIIDYNNFTVEVLLHFSLSLLKKNVQTDSQNHPSMK